jgi:hypothetical protein
MTSWPERQAPFSQQVAFTYQTTANRLTLYIPFDAVLSVLEKEILTDNEIFN